MRLSDGAIITGAPVITRNGRPTFTDADMDEYRFKYNPNDVTPGLLNHAEHPNPRTAVIIPTNLGWNANFRLVTAFANKRGGEGTGFTMVEWARVAAWLSILNDQEERTPTEIIALNLDGGTSTVMGADLCRQKLLGLCQYGNTRTPYLVAVAPLFNEEFYG